MAALDFHQMALASSWIDFEGLTDDELAEALVVARKLAVRATRWRNAGDIARLWRAVERGALDHKRR
jgi:hypothetical protein